MKQISDDLRAAIQDPISKTTAPSLDAAPVRRFGMVGSRHELRFDVLQVTPEQGNPVPVGQTWRGSGDSSEARVPELRTVYYSFTSASLSSEQSPDGFVRRESDFETPIKPADEIGLGASAVVDLLGDQESANASDRDETTLDDYAAHLADASVTWVPEVVAAEFRFFDGQGWTGSWNSLQRKSLPVAVEVVLRMSDSDASEQPEAISDEEGSATEDIITPPSTAYRLIVDLPGSPSYREPRISEPSASRRPPQRLAPRRIAPPRFPAEPQPQPAPEEGIRTKQ